VTGEAGDYRLKAGQAIEVYGTFGISVHALDFLNGYPNKCGVYSIELQVDSSPLMAQRFDELDFETVRNINAYKDYEVYHQNSWHYHKSYIEPGNALEIYQTDSNKRGQISFVNDGMHTASYTIADAYGNTSRLEFSFESVSVPGIDLPAPEPYDAYFSYSQENTFAYENEMGIVLPARALYNDLEFRFGREVQKSPHLTPAYQVHFDVIPLEKPFEIIFDLSKIPSPVWPSLIAVRYDTEGRPRYLNGTVENGTFKTESKEFGKFALISDVDPPSAILLNSRDKYKFKISDDRSGIKTYDVWAGEKWILAEYDPKRNLLEINPSELSQVSKGSVLRLVLTDGVGNKLEQEYSYNP
jgi:hypothetical protein